MSKTITTTRAMVEGWKRTLLRRDDGTPYPRRELKILGSGIDDVLAALDGTAPREALGDAAIRDLNHAIGALPYGGLLPRWRVETVEDVASMLREFAGVLHGVAERADTNERELRELKSQRAAVRAFLGTGEGE